MSVVPTCVRDPCHMDHHPGRNIYMTHWFILSVLFLTGSETSVGPTCVLHPPSKGLPLWYEHLPDQLIHSVGVVFTRR